MFLGNCIVGFKAKIDRNSSPEINMPPEKKPFQQKNSLPPIIFSWDMLDFLGGNTPLGFEHI